MRSILTLATFILATSASSVLAQNPGQNVAVDVRVISVTRNFDTTGIAYVVTNLPTSTELLGRFSVDAPGGVLRITRPAPANRMGH